MSSFEALREQANPAGHTLHEEVDLLREVTMVRLRHRRTHMFAAAAGACAIAFGAWGCWWFVTDGGLRVDPEPRTGRLAKFRADVQSPDARQIDRLLDGLIEDLQIARGESHANFERRLLAFESLRAFVESSLSPGWGAALGDDDRTAKIMTLLGDGFLYAGCGNGSGSHVDPVAMLTKAQISTRLRHRIAENIVSQSRGTTLDTRICDMLAPESIPRLRALLEGADGARPETFPCGPAFCLGHLGDQASESILIKIADVVEQPLSTDLRAATFRPRMAALLRAYARMIQVQQPPTLLLDVICDPTSVEDDLDWLQGWALARGVELKVDKASLRAAFNTYQTAVRQSVATGPQMRHGFQHPRLYRLNDLEDYAVRLGVLDASELPPRPKRPIPD